MLSKFAIRSALLLNTPKSTTFPQCWVSSSANKSRLATSAVPVSKQQLSSQQIFDREEKYGAHNYHPLPVALSGGKGNETSL